MKIKINDLKKIIKEELQRAFDGPKTRDIVLVNDGSFNPVHRGHVQVTLLASEFLKKANYNVIALYMCPNHDKWLKRKFASNESDIIPAEIRMGLLKHAIQGTNIIASDWELKQSSYQTGEAFKNYFESIHPNSTFIRIVGDDYGQCSPVPCLEFINNYWQIRMPRIDGISSSKIRQMIKNNQELDDMSTPEVVSYMKSKKNSNYYV